MNDEAPTAAGRRWLTHPVLSLLLAGSWLLLQDSLALPQWLVAAALGVLIPRLLHPFLGKGARIRRPALALRLFLVVLWDIVLSNLTVARLVLSPGARPQPAWLTIPLELRDPQAIALLASIITMTPGTVSCIVDDEAGHLLVHALDCPDPPALIQQIRQRYEKAIKEILE